MQALGGLHSRYRQGLASLLAGGRSHHYPRGAGAQACRLEELWELGQEVSTKISEKGLGSWESSPEKGTHEAARVELQVQ